MPITTVSGLEPRQLFTTDGKDVWECVGYFKVPSLTLQNLRTGEQTSFGLGELIAESFSKLVKED